LSTSSTPTVASLNAFLQQINAAFQYLHGFAGEFAAVFPNDGSAVGVTDAVGHVGRVHAEVDAASLEGVTGAESQALTALIQAGGLSRYLSNGNINPFPEPGTVNNPGSASASRPLAARPSFG
jgi:hypothetical protein